MIQFSYRLLSSLSAADRQACVETANSAFPHCDQTAYLTERFPLYDAVLMAHDESGLAAFQLMQRFRTDQGWFVYLGPLYSRRKAYLPMLFHFFRSAMDTWPDETLHFMAELQNPDLLLVCKTLFQRSYPLLQTRKIPLTVRQTAHVFVERIAHIEGFRPDNLSSRGSHTLYRAAAGSDAVMTWLHARGVRLDRGDSQILLLTCPADASSRSRLMRSRERRTGRTGRKETYRRLSPLLPEYARSFWDRHPHLLALGVNQCGATERFYRFIAQNIRRNLYGDEIWQELLSCRTLKEQAAFRERYLTSDAWRTAVRLLLSKTTHLQFFPAHMFAQAREQDFGAFFDMMFRRELERRLIGNNYFFTQLMFGTYLLDRPEGAPHYLSEEGFAAAKRNLHKLRVLPLSLQQALPQMQGIDAFFLSNVFDWSDESQRAAICAAVLGAKSREAVLLYRNMLSAPPLPEAFRERVAVDEAWSQEMTGLDRSMMYRQITVGVLR